MPKAREQEQTNHSTRSNHDFIESLAQKDQYIKPKEIDSPIKSDETQEKQKRAPSIRQEIDSPAIAIDGVADFDVQRPVRAHQEVARCLIHPDGCRHRRRR